MTDTNPLADQVRAAAEQLHAAATETATCDPLDQQAVILTPGQAHAIANAWEHISDEMDDHGAHEVPLKKVTGKYTKVVKNENGGYQFDWNATLDAARIYRGEATS
jgi:hypothetical protein